MGLVGTAGRGLGIAFGFAFGFGFGFGLGGWFVRGRGVGWGVGWGTKVEEVRKTLSTFGHLEEFSVDAGFSFSVKDVGIETAWSLVRFIFIVLDCIHQKINHI